MGFNLSVNFYDSYTTFELFDHFLWYNFMKINMMSKIKLILNLNGLYSYSFIV